MARRGFSCPNCHTWFEGEGNHPRCPLCGTRASPRDLLDARESGSQPPGTAYRPAGDEIEEGWTFGERPDYEIPREAPPDWDAPPPPEAETAPLPSVPPGPQREESNWSSQIGPVIGVLIFVAIIASRICQALTDSE